MNIKNFSTKDLQKELETRGGKPQMKTEFNLDNLKDVCQSYVDYIDSEEFHEDNDYDYYLSEAVMTTLFGRYFWEWYNEQVK